MRIPTDLDPNPPPPRRILAQNPLFKEFLDPPLLCIPMIPFTPGPATYVKTNMVRQRPYKTKLNHVHLSSCWTVVGREKGGARFWSRQPSPVFPLLYLGRRCNNGFRANHAMTPFWSRWNMTTKKLRLHEESPSKGL